MATPVGRASRNNSLQVGRSQNLVAPPDSSRYELHQANAENLPFEDNSFDAIYICWVLEHVTNPQKIIDQCYRVLRKGGIISITEVQNNNLYLVPQSNFLDKYWKAYNDLQLEMGGNPFVGVEIGNFISNSGFKSIDVYSNNYLLDNNKPEARTTMVNYWTDLLLSGFDSLVECGKIDKTEEGLVEQEMKKVDTHNGVFNYSCVQASGIK